MTKSRYLIAFAPLLLTACGGGGGGSEMSSSASTPSGAKVITAQESVQRDINDFISTVAATQSTTPDENLTGIWIEAAGDIRSESGLVNLSSTSSDTTNTIYHVHFVMDNGNSLDVSDCSTALTLYTFHFDGDGNVVWSNFKGDTKPTGTITSNKQIDFGTTSYSGTTTSANTDLSYSGDYTSRWIKLDTSLQATIGTVSGSGISKDIACANLKTSTGTVDGDDSESFSVLFREKNGDWLTSDSSSGDDMPTRLGKTFTLYVSGAKVQFKLN